VKRLFPFSSILLALAGCQPNAPNPGAEVQEQCPPEARLLLDTAIGAVMAGAYFSIDDYYRTGADTLGFHATNELLGDGDWFVSGASVRCIGSEPSHAQFEVTWNAEARLVGYHGLERAKQTLTDTVSLSYRWIINDLDFLLFHAYAEQAHHWSFSEEDRQFIDSLIRRGGRSYPEEGRAQCPEPAYGLLGKALDGGLSHDSGIDAMGFIRAEALGDSDYLVFDVFIRCLSGSPSHALFQVTQTTAGEVPHSGGLWRYEERSSTSDVSISQRWVIDDLRVLTDKCGNPGLLRSRDFEPGFRPLLDSIVPPRPLEE